MKTPDLTVKGFALMHWEAYTNWCEENGKDVLIRPGGILRIGDCYYRDDGFIYIKKRKIGRYLTAERLCGVDVVLKQETLNERIKRFERIRWAVFEHIDLLESRLKRLGMELWKVTRAPKRTPASGLPTFYRGSSTYCMYRGVLHTVSVEQGSVSDPQPIDDDHPIKVTGGPVPRFKDLEPLDQLARIPRDTAAERIAAKWIATRESIKSYWNTISVFESCLRWLFQEIHPDNVENRPRSWNRPVMIAVNGRTYPVTRGMTNNKDTDYWPTPYDLPVQVL